MKSKGILLVLGVTVLVIATYIIGCARAIPELADAEAALEATKEAGAPELAPAEYQATEELIRKAKELIAQGRHGEARELLEEARYKAVEAEGRALIAKSEGEMTDIAIEVSGPKEIRRNIPYPLLVSVVNTGPEGSAIVVREVRLQNVRRAIIDSTKLQTRIMGMGREKYDAYRELRRKYRGEALYQAHYELDVEEEHHHLAREGHRPEEHLKPPTIALVEKAKSSTARATLGFTPSDHIKSLSAGASITVPLEVIYESGGRLQTKQVFYSAVVAEPYSGPAPPPGVSQSGWFFGDTHVHSSMSDASWDPNKGDFSINQLADLVYASGLDWMNLADHAYAITPSELNNQIDRAASETNERRTQNADGSFTYNFLMIPGIELSAVQMVPSPLNGQCTFYDPATPFNITAHVIGFGLRKGADFGWQSGSNGQIEYVLGPASTAVPEKTPTVQDVIDKLRHGTVSKQGAVSIAHPGGADLDFLYDMTDKAFLCASGYSGIEIIARDWDNSQDPRAIEKWIHRSLLRGNKTAVYAGSDLHNVGEPLGDAVTAVYANSLDPNDPDGIEFNLKRGRTFVTTGGMGVAVWAREAQTSSPWSWMGDIVDMNGSETNRVELYVSYKYGCNSDLKIYGGRIGGKQETLFHHLALGSYPGCSTSKSFQITVPLPSLGFYYFRAQLIHRTDETDRAYSSPVYVSRVSEPSARPFGIFLNTNSLVQVSGSTAQVAVGIRRDPGFSNAVVLQLTSPNSGITGSFSPASPTGNTSTLTINVAGSVVPGSYNLTVRGTSGSKIETANLILTVKPFSLSLSKSDVILSPGDSDTVAVTITRSPGFTDSVDLSLEGTRLGIGHSFSADPTTGNTSTLTLNITGSVAPGRHNLSVRGTSGSKTDTADLTLMANSFTISLSTPDVILSPGGSAEVTVTITRSPSFTDSVDLSLEGLPPTSPGEGIGHTFNPDPTTGNTSTLSLSAGRFADPEDYSLTVRGTGGSVIGTATLSVEVVGSGKPEVPESGQP